MLNKTALLDGAPRPSLWRVIAAFVCVSLICGCGRRTEQKPLGPPPVTMITPMERQVTQWDEYTGHLESPETVHLAARVSGLILSAPFKEGSIVRQGDLLFQIDPKPFRADLDSKEADIAKAKAQVVFAEAQLQRYQKMLPTQAVSQQDYDNAKAALQEAQATLDAVTAAAESSRLNLEWTRVTAPITGRISRKYVTEGNLVTGGAGQATPLTSITSVDPIYCYVDVPEEAFLRYQAMKPTSRPDVRKARIPCFVRIGNEGEFAHKGVIDFVDNQVNPATGTLRVRGVIENPDGLLVPGLFARMRIPAGPPHRALLVPDAALIASQNIRYVLIVGNNDVVEQRTVETGALFGNLREIVKGLSGNERVIISGQQMAKVGAKVSPHEQPPTTAPSGLNSTTAPTAGRTSQTGATTHAHP